MSSKAKHVLILVGVAIVAAAYSSKIPLVGLISAKLPGSDWTNPNATTGNLNLLGNLISPPSNGS